MDKAGLRNLQWLFVGALTYFALGRLGTALFSMQPDNIALLWLPAGIGLAMARFAGARALPWIFVASLAANYPGMVQGSAALHLLHTAVAAGSNVLETWLALLLFRRFLPDGLTGLKDLLLLLVLVAIPSTAVNALALSANLVAGGYLALGDGLVVGALLVFSNSLGMLMMVPLISAWRHRPRFSAAEFWEWAGLTLLTSGLVWLAFHCLAGFIYLVIPALMIQVFRGRSDGLYLTMTLALCLVTGMAARTLGPFNLPDDIQSHALLVSYLFTTALLVIGVNLQHRDLQREMYARKAWQFRANHDPLTGLGNRLLFMPALKQEIQRSRRSGRAFSLAVIDVDHFKSINDTFGHAVGDRVLEGVAGALAADLRAVDTVARIGGEEFAILFPDTSLDEARQAMERIRTAVAQTELNDHGQRGAVTISCGVIECRAHRDTSVDSVLLAADQLLYTAKREGRNRVGAGVMNHGSER